MSIQAMVWALEQKCPSPVSKLVLITLANYANHDGECWPSQARIARDCSVTRPHVCAQIKLLENLGFIENKTRMSDRGQQTSLYFLRCQPADREGVSLLKPPVSGVYTEPTIEPVKKDSVADATDAGASPQADPIKDIYDRGVAILGEKRRSLLAKYVRDYGDTVVLAAIVACEEEPRIDPPAFFIRCCEERRRDAPQNYHAKPIAKMSPVEKLYLGGYRAAQNAIRRHGIVEDDPTPAFPLLDGGRSASDA